MQVLPCRLRLENTHKPSKNFHQLCEEDSRLFSQLSKNKKNKNAEFNQRLWA